MHEQPEPTDEEQEQAEDRLPDEDAMRYPGHDDPRDTVDAGSVVSRRVSPIAANEFSRVALLASLPGDRLGDLASRMKREEVQPGKTV